MRKTGNPIFACYDNSGIFPEQSLYFAFNKKTDKDIDKDIDKFVNPIVKNINTIISYYTQFHKNVLESSEELLRLKF